MSLLWNARHKWAQKVTVKARKVRDLESVHRYEAQMEMFDSVKTVDNKTCVREPPPKLTLDSG